VRFGNAVVPSIFRYEYEVVRASDSHFPK
jgi:hypothetical protein